MMGRFLMEGIVGKDAAVDSAIMPCKKIWQTDMQKGRLPVSGIGADAKWGFSKARKWVFGYKLHI